MTPNSPFFPCQTEDGRTFVMRGVVIVQEIGGYETTERWRTAQALANKLNDDFNRGRVSRRERISIVLTFFLMVVPLADIATGGAIVEFVVQAFNRP